MINKIPRLQTPMEREANQRGKPRQPACEDTWDKHRELRPLPAKAKTRIRTKRIWKELMRIWADAAYQSSDDNIQS